MKTSLPKTLLVSLGLALAGSPFLHAANVDQPARPNRQELMKQFDANGDGQLDQVERQAARQHMQSLRPGGAVPGQGQGPGQQGARPGGGRAMARFDTDGDGQLSAVEREAAGAAIREHIVSNPRAMQRFDLDGDGNLSDEEWTQARAKVGQRLNAGGRGQAGGQGGKPGKGRGANAGG